MSGKSSIERAENAHRIQPVWEFDFKRETDPDGRTVTLTIPDRRAQYVYEVNCSHLSNEDHELFPKTGYYTMNRLPLAPTE
ncbi:MAG: hypothetical protein R3C02_22520 [Planctomycetaceae bacterium]